jgi:hypothetical protein
MYRLRLHLKFLPTPTPQPCLDQVIHLQKNLFSGVSCRCIGTSSVLHDDKCFRQSVLYVAHVHSNKNDMICGGRKRTEFQLFKVSYVFTCVRLISLLTRER